MTLGLVGRKIGMTRLFTDDGDAVPVTVVDVSNNRVTQVKTPATDGYSAVQIAYGRRRPSRVIKAEAGHFAKAGVQPGVRLVEPNLLKVREFAQQEGGPAAAKRLLDNLGLRPASNSNQLFLMEPGDQRLKSLEELKWKVELIQVRSRYEGTWEATQVTDE